MAPDDIRRLARGAGISEEQAERALMSGSPNPEAQARLARHAIRFPPDSTPEQRAAVVHEKFAYVNLDCVRPAPELERAVFGYVDSIDPPTGSFKADALQLLCHPAVTPEIIEGLRQMHLKMMADIERVVRPILGRSLMAVAADSIESDPETEAYLENLFRNDELKDPL